MAEQWQLLKSLLMVPVAFQAICGVCYAESMVDEGSSLLYIESLENLPDNIDPTGWTAATYNIGADNGKGDNGTGWQIGTCGVGYGDGDDNTLIGEDGSVYSVYTRIEFNVADVTEVTLAELQVDYDDGFIAWINGVEVARSLSMIGVTPEWNASTSAQHESSQANPPTYENFDISAFIGSLVDGKNVLAIGIWNWAPTSSDLTIIPKLNLSYSVSLTPLLSRYPYVQKVTSDSATIVWNTDVDSDSQLEYGPTQAYGNEAYDSVPVSQHIMTLIGLNPDTRYYYRVVGDGSVLTSSGMFFRTNQDVLGSDYTFVVFGDSGVAAPAQSAVAELIEDVSPDLALHTGDVIYFTGEAVDYNAKYFIPYKETIKQVPLYPSLGNHDILNADGNPPGQPYLDAFVLPEVESGSGTERYYSFDYANAHFIALDVVSSDYLVGSDQYLWLENDLAATDKLWKFVFFHYPAYSGNVNPGHGSFPDIQSALSPLFEQYGVDMVFTGHSHNYERTKPITEGSISLDGVTYVVTGGGGGLREFDANLVPQWWTTSLQSAYHLTKITIDGDYLGLKAVKPDGTSDGEVFDSHTIIKNILIHDLVAPSNRTVAPGGSLESIREIMASKSASVYQFNVRPYAINPNAEIVWLSPAPMLISLPPGGVYTPAYSLSIPVFAEEGVYHYGIRLTNLSDGLIDDKSFSFVISSGGLVSSSTQRSEVSSHGEELNAWRIRR